jgi:phosphorylcholine metabolism protein LicD
MDNIAEDIDTLVKCQRIQLNLALEFKSICDKHQLQYWLHDGTLLGAIRHQGFIPWDDDFDVAMPMKDYEAFLRIAPKELSAKVFLQTSKTDINYKQLFAKLRDNGSTFIEVGEPSGMDYHQGIYLDIFPVITYPKIPTKLLKWIASRAVARRHEIFVLEQQTLTKYAIYLLIKFIWSLFFIKSNNFSTVLEDNGYALTHSYDCLHPLSYATFGGHTFNVPKDPRRYLEDVYGPNYMTPTPPKERKPHARLISPDSPCHYVNSKVAPMSSSDTVDRTRLAPIAIFTYSRLTNLKEAITALQNNELASESDLFIFSDAPRTTKDETAVRAVRHYLRSISGFKSTTIIEREENHYIEQNIILGVSEVINRYGSIIVLEDDGKCEKTFLIHMNRMLQFYENSKRIMHLSGVTFVKMPQAFRKVILWRYSENAGGGWATWKDRWEKFHYFATENEALSLLTSEQCRYLQMNGALNCLECLKLNPIPWDICWYIAITLNNGLAVNTPRSLVQNLGLYRGTHFKRSRLLGKNPFDVESLPLKSMFLEPNIVENSYALEKLKRFYADIGRPGWRGIFFS